MIYNVKLKIKNETHLFPSSVPTPLNYFPQISPSLQKNTRKTLRRAKQKRKFANPHSPSLYLYTWIGNISPIITDGTKLPF